jgi:hypothetical protein
VPAAGLSDQVLSQLRRIVDPDFGEDIVACGFVKDMAIDEAAGAVAFKLELTTPACPVKDQFKREAMQYVQVCARGRQRRRGGGLGLAQAPQPGPLRTAPRRGASSRRPPRPPAGPARLPAPPACRLPSLHTLTTPPSTPQHGRSCRGSSRWT